jgi:hypothetical protein
VIDFSRGTAISRLTFARVTSAAISRRSSRDTAGLLLRLRGEQGDFFAIPPWSLHAHADEGSAPADLSSFQDVPLLRALGFYLSEA